MLNAKLRPRVLIRGQRLPIPAKRTVERFGVNLAPGSAHHLDSRHLPYHRIAEISYELPNPNSHIHDR